MGRKLTAGAPGALAALVAMAVTVSCAGPAQPSAAGPGAAPPASSSRAGPPAAPPSADVLPPRPTELSLARINPCDLLTLAQAKQLAVGPPAPAATNDGLGSRDCAWNTGWRKRGASWLARVMERRGAEYYLSRDTEAEQIPVDGFTAVATSSGVDNPEQHCLLYLDVAAGQSLAVAYDNLTGDKPGMDHRVACQNAVKAAHLMLGNLKRLTGH
jgi:hypothetical protein